MSWWAEYGDLAMEADGTVWRLAEDGGATAIGHIERGHGLTLTDEQWRLWERLERDWRDETDGRS